MQRKYFHSLYKFYCLMLIWVFVTPGCKKFLEPDYKNQVTTDVVFANDDNARAAVYGLYSTTQSDYFFGGTGTLMTGYSGDEIKYYTSFASYDAFIQNQLLPTTGPVQNFWDGLYKVIYQSNSIIENSQVSDGMSDGYKKQAIAEAKFFRAFGHFYLVNLFGPVPLITTTDKNVTSYAPRSTVDDIYTQIKADLTDALNNLPADYSIYGNKRIQANKWAAAALLARVNLYTKDYVNAEVMASAVLANANLYSLQSNLNISLKNNNEIILAFQSFNSNTQVGSFFVSPATFINNPMLPGLINSFENGDLRKTNWIKTIGSSATPYKYKLALGATPNSEDHVVLRVAEQYLVRAEARAQQNKISEAQADINVIRKRAGLANDTTMVDKATALAAIEKERRVELFCEFGHRWFDLNRWPSATTPGKTRADDVLGSLKPTWKSTAILFPIPQSAMNANPNLTQNEGY